MNNKELREYARENRKHLKTQEVKLGDVIKVLIGHFAGETGVVVGIMAIGEDYTDPYYEVNMNCEVPERYKCRKTLVTPNNIIGGLSASDFEVIGNRAPMLTNNEIKIGDKVRMSKDIPSLFTVEWTNEMFDLDLVVKRLEDGYAKVSFANPTEYVFSLDVIPTKYLVKVEDEKQNDMTNEELKKAAKEWSENMSAAIKEYGNAVCETYTNAVAEAYWDGYAAALAKEVAVKIANKYSDVEQVAKDAVKLAKSVVENLKKK